MNDFTPEQINTILTIAVVVAGAIASILGAVAYGWKRSSDAKVVKAQADAEEAKNDSANLSNLIAIMGRQEQARSEERAAHIGTLTAIKDEIHDLRITDTQRIEKASLAAAQVVGARDDIRQLGASFKEGKDDAVKQVSQAMDDKLKPIQQRLEAIEVLLHEVRELVSQQGDAPAEPPNVVGEIGPEAKPESSEDKTEASA
jgi:hypothetical protein